MTKATTPAPAPQKKKNKGLIIGLIVGAALLLLICFILATVALVRGASDGIFKDLNVEGSGDPRKNTSLITNVEGYAGVEKATINCSTPVPWDYQSCVLGIQVERTITEAQLRDVAGAFIPSITNGDLGSTPKGIILTVGDRPYVAPLESTVIVDTESVNEAVPVFYQALQDASVSGLSVNSQTGDYSSISLSAEPSYGAICEKAKSYAEAVNSVTLQHATYPEVDINGAVIRGANGVSTCVKLMQYADTQAEKSADIRRISTTSEKVRLTYKTGVSEEVRTDAKNKLTQVLVGTSLTVAE